MKILMILSKQFMTDYRVYKEAKSLVDAGHEVAVLVWDRKNENTTKDIVDGIQIVYLRHTFFMKLLPGDLFRNPFWWRNAYKKGLHMYKTNFQFDVVHCHDLDTLQIGVWLKKKLKIKLIYDAHEIFGYMIQGNVPKTVVSFAFRFEKKLVRFVDHIITANDLFKQYFEKISKQSITVVMNCKELMSTEYTPSKNTMFTVVYIGVFGKGRLFPEIIDTIATESNIKFVIAGKKENMKIYEQVEKTSKKYDNVEFLGSIPFHDVLPWTSKADVVLCPLDPNLILNRLAIATKQFEAMVCGRPILCIQETYAGIMTGKLHCGLVVPYSCEAIKHAVITLRDNPILCRQLGETALHLALEKYNWNHEEKKLLAVYKKFIVS